MSPSTSVYAPGVSWHVAAEAIAGHSSGQAAISALLKSLIAFLPGSALRGVDTVLRHSLGSLAMGYRSQNNYDDAERETWRKLPWRERYDWRLVLIVAVVLAAFATGLMVRIGVGR